MKIHIIISLVLTVLFNSVFSQSINKNIQLLENKLQLKVPNDLIELWNDSTLKSKNRKFYFRNFSDLTFLVPDELTEYTKYREVGGAMNEQNKLYYLSKEGKITKEEKRELTNSFYRDIVMMSKSHTNEKVLVFATSTWREGFIDMYYKFDSEGKTIGIFLTDGDQGSHVPINLGENLIDVFGQIQRIKNGFSSDQEYMNLWRKYYNQDFIPRSDFPFGIFPQKDMRVIIDSIVPSIYVTKNKEISELEDSVKISVSELYKIQGKEIDFNEKNTSTNWSSRDLSSFLKDKNCQSFNDKQNRRIFIVEFPNSENIGIVSCSPEQARELNELGVLRYDWRVRAEKEFEFMNY